MRKDVRDSVRQFVLCQTNKVCNTLLHGNSESIPFSSEIFFSFSIHLMDPFTKLNGHCSLLVVNGGMRFNSLIGTSVTAPGVPMEESL